MKLEGMFRPQAPNTFVLNKRIDDAVYLYPNQWDSSKTDYYGMSYQGVVTDGVQASNPSDNTHLGII